MRCFIFPIRAVFRFQILFSKFSINKKEKKKQHHTRHIKTNTLFASSKIKYYCTSDICWFELREYYVNDANRTAERTKNGTKQTTRYKLGIRWCEIRHKWNNHIHGSRYNILIVICIVYTQTYIYINNS